MSSHSLTTFSSLLAEKNYRMTAPRLALFHALDGSKPLSISQLLQKTSLKSDRVSIYRNVELFEQIGIITRVTIGWKYKLELSDLFKKHHHHLSCISCGVMIDTDNEQAIDIVIKELTDKIGFKPVNHYFEIDGYCRMCRDAPNARPLS